jgi:hypothetical protein
VTSVDAAIVEPLSHTRASVGRVTTVAQLASLVVVSTTFWAALSWGMPAPWVVPDEIIYSELAKSIAAGHLPAIREATTFGFGVVYPLLLAPAWWLFQDVQRAYAAALITNAALMSLSAIPAYFLARRFVRHAGALLVASFTVFVPGMAYTGMLLTENVFYPAFLLALLAIARALERPTTSTQVTALAAIMLAFAAKLLALVLVPIYLTAVVGVAALERRHGHAAGETLRRYRSTFVIAGIAIAGGTAASMLVGRGTTGMLGAYSGVLRAADLRRVPWSFLEHLGAFSLTVAVIPFAATLVVVVAAVRGVDASPRAVRFSVLAASVVVWLALTVAVSSKALSDASAGSGAYAHVHERYLFVAAPVFLIGLALFVETGLGRLRRLVLSSAVAAAALVALIPVPDLWSNANLQVPSLLPWLLFEGFGQVALAVAAVLAAFVLVKISSNARALWIPVGCAFFVAAILAVSSFKVHAGWARDFGISVDRSWIDKRVGFDSKVAVLWNEPFPTKFAPVRNAQRVVWENEFFNRSVGTVYALGARNPEELPEDRARVAADGRVVHLSGAPATAQFVLTCGVKLDAATVARDEATGATLYRTDGVVRARPSGVGICASRGDVLEGAR